MQRAKESFKYALQTSGLMNVYQDEKELVVFVRRVHGIRIHFGPVDTDGVELVFSQDVPEVDLLEKIGLKPELVYQQFIQDSLQVYVQANGSLNSDQSATKRKYFSFLNGKYEETDSGQDATIIVYSVRMQQHAVAFQD